MICEVTDIDVIEQYCFICVFRFDSVWKLSHKAVENMKLLVFKMFPLQLHETFPSSVGFTVCGMFYGSMRQQARYTFINT